MMAAAILMLVTRPFCLSLDAWWEFRWQAASYGVSRSDVDYYIRINKQAGWRTPEEKF